MICFTKAETELYKKFQGRSVGLSWGFQVSVFGIRLPEEVKLNL